jgi:hypothetical protein
MLTLLGIRHHGPGSARSVRGELARLRPDCILVEGPPDADALIPLAAHAEMAPPVALLIYLPDAPQRAVYYPFAEFSPEWQAIQYALERNLPVRFMDLAQAVQLGKESDQKVETSNELPDDNSLLVSRYSDPFSLIAEAAGYSDGERWWEHFVEQRRESGDVFQGILELMGALRAEEEQHPGPDHAHNLLREAAMRTIIRQAQAEGHQNIAIICGAWHAPALAQPGDEKADAKLLKGLPKRDVAATWVPWTYDRLSRRSGYGAGIDSPGWYEHLWLTESHIVERWMVKVAQLMRQEDLGISPAHAIEATRLAETLAALRERPLPGLPELDEAVQAIFCFGDDAPMRLSRQKLIIGVRMGSIPPEAPTVPLQRDLTALQKRTRLEPSTSPEVLDLDLRKPLLLERSQLLHRLNILGIPWGKLQTAHGAKGTFHEIWQVEWKPEFAVAVIEASLWGNTVLEAATGKVNAQAAQATELPTLTTLVEAALLADLAEAIPGLMARLQQLAAASGDIPHLMDALPPLANVLRYGNVRQTDTSVVRQVVDELITRICIGLPPACSSLDDDAAGEMFGRINAVQSALGIVQVPLTPGPSPAGGGESSPLPTGEGPGVRDYAADWSRSLELLAAQESVHGLVRGRASRLLFDRTESSELTATRMSQALSPGTPTPQAAAWVEGFLHGSGQALIHHLHLWQMVDAWALALPEEQFNAVLPLLRRTFSTFSASERRQIGELAKTGGRVAAAVENLPLDPLRAEKALTLVKFILEAKQETSNQK